MRKRLYSALSVCAVSIIAVCSCVKEEIPAGGSGRGFIEPVVTSAGEMTKSGGVSADGRYMGRFIMEGFGGESLYLSVYEYDNTDIPAGLSGEEPQTKGEVVTTESINALNSRFTIDAWLESANRYDGSQDGDGRVYVTSDKDNWHIMDGVTVERGTSDWSYTSGLEYPWRNKVATNFWSVYPVSVSGRSVTLPTNTATDAQQKALTFSYALPSACTAAPYRDAENQPDLCFAYNNKTWEDGDDNKVNIEFHHALSAVYFSVEGVIDGVTVQRIGFDDVMSSGVCDVTGNADNTPSFTWRDRSQPRDYTQDYTYSTDFNAAGDTQPFLENDKIYMMIPQTLGSDTKLRAQFRLGDNSVVTRTVDISKFENGTSVEWKPGKKYLYKLSFSDYTFTFSLVNAGDATQTFDNTTLSGSTTIPLNSYKETSSGVRTPADWEIESIRIGSAAAETIGGTSFSGKGGLSATTTISSNNSIYLTSAEREGGISYGSNNYWTNKGGISGDTDGSGWSPKSWGSDGENRGVIDLSKYDFQNETTNNPMTTANCYVIRHAGTYKLPLVYGNGIVNGAFNVQSYAPAMAAGGDASRFLSPFENHLGYGIFSPFIDYNTRNGNPNSSNYIVPSGSRILWQESADIITIDGISKESVTVKNASGVNETFSVSYLTFTIPQDKICQNNALLAVTDAGGDIIWSWHIWTTNDPGLLQPAIPVKNHNGITYNFFPIYNLGCVEGDNYPARDEIIITLRQKVSNKTIVLTVRQPEVKSDKPGCYYQFGRKDPTPRKDNVTGARNASVASTLAGAIQNPDTMYGVPGNWCSSSYYNLWTGGYCGTSAIENTQAGLCKTVYDPSPRGYMMPASNAFTGFTISGTGSIDVSEFNVDGPYSRGWNYRTNTESGPANIFFAAEGHRRYLYFNISDVGTKGNYWSAVSYSTSSGFQLSFNEADMVPLGMYGCSNALSVRPVTDINDMSDPNDLNGSLNPYIGRLINL